MEEKHDNNQLSSEIDCETRIREQEEIDRQKSHEQHFNETNVDINDNI